MMCGRGHKNILRKSPGSCVSRFSEGEVGVASGKGGSCVPLLISLWGVGRRAFSPSVHGVRVGISGGEAFCRRICEILWEDLFCVNQSICLVW